MIKEFIMIRVDLSGKEKMLIRAICRWQISSLNDILNNTCPLDDVKLFCLENGVNELELEETVVETMASYEMVREHPEFFLALDPGELSVIRHILHVIVKDKTLKKTKRSLWRKMNWKDRIIESNTINFLN